MKSTSLKDFIAQRPLRKCAVCSLGQRAEIDEEYRNGLRSFKTIMEWLESIGVENISMNNLKHHFYSKHHEVKNGKAKANK